MGRRTFDTAAGIALAGLCLVSLPASSSRGDDAVTAATRILETHFTEEISRRWYGGETFCLFGPHRDSNAEERFGPFLGAVNRAYGTDFKLTMAHGYDVCPDFTTIYAMIGPPVGPGTLADILEGLEGRYRPINFVYDLAKARGFALHIHGDRNYGNRPREFIYVNDTVPPIRSNPDPVRSIMIEETLHALTTLGDFDSDAIISVLGETPDVTYYDDWFERNPRGLCAADLIMLEMQVGRTLGQFSRRGRSLEWLEEHSESLRELTPILQAELADFTDERCQESPSATQ